ncbi:tetraspanin-32 isoform X1 [Trichechus manatus latirostris]|uniref:Tetraspanin-32 isoform X1 n=1 Tax=Trichechus manatus latirostris TaxID=127582 RepID=A0A2Y9QER1_TRIMA|nr:tetraspanin-32 isoform X1 [Trichechus manatus latirostris]
MVLRRPPRIASRAGFPAGPSLCLHTPLTGSSPLPRCPSSRAVLCSHTKTTASPPPERPPGPAVPRGLGLAAPPFLPALLPGHPVAESFWVGSCGLRPPPSWKPQWQRGEKGRGEGRLGQESTPTWGLGAESGSPNARCCSPASLSCCWACLWPPWLFIPTSGPTLLPSAVRPWRGTPTRPCTTGGFLCFALVFCALLQVVFWRFYNPTQVEDAVLDTYDLVYEQAVRSPSSVWRQELAAIQDTFQCCGKWSPFGLLGDAEAGLCPGELARREVRRAARASGPSGVAAGHHGAPPQTQGHAPRGSRGKSRCGPEGEAVVREARRGLGWGRQLTTGPFCIHSFVHTTPARASPGQARRPCDPAAVKPPTPPSEASSSTGGRRETDGV